MKVLFTLLISIVLISQGFTQTTITVLDSTVTSDQRGNPLEWTVYDYDNLGRQVRTITLVTHTSYPDGLMTIKDSVVYDGAGHILEQITEEYNTATSAWLPTRRVLSTYTGHNATTVLHQEYNSG